MCFALRPCPKNIICGVIQYDSIAVGFKVCMCPNALRINTNEIVHENIVCRNLNFYHVMPTVLTAPVVLPSSGSSDEVVGADVGVSVFLISACLGGSNVLL
jgi:hypothetical protein